MMISAGAVSEFCEKAANKESPGITTTTQNSVIQLRGLGGLGVLVDERVDDDTPEVVAGKDLLGGLHHTSHRKTERLGRTKIEIKANSARDRGIDIRGAARLQQIGGHQAPSLPRDGRAVSGFACLVPAGDAALGLRHRVASEAPVSHEGHTIESLPPFERQGTIKVERIAVLGQGCVEQIVILQTESPSTSPSAEPGVALHIPLGGLRADRLALQKVVGTRWCNTAAGCSALALAPARGEGITFGQARPEAGIPRWDPKGAQIWSGKSVGRSQSPRGYGAPHEGEPPSQRR